MPLYEYTCGKCSSDFELLIRSDEKPVCPECGSRRLERHMSAAAAHSAGGSKALPVCGMPSMAACGQPECSMGQCALK